MPENRYSVNITNLGLDEPREVNHIADDGTPLRAEILEANTRHFKARVLEPFRTILFRELPMFVVALTPFGFVSIDGKATQMLIATAKEAMLWSYSEWQRMRQGREYFQAHRETLTPKIRETHRQAAVLCKAAEALVEDMRILGSILEAELLQMRHEYRIHFKNGFSTQHEYQTRLKALGENGPPTDLGLFILADGRALQTRFKVLRDQLEKTKEAFTHDTGMQLDDAFEFLHLESLPLDPRQRRDLVEWLPNLSLTVHLMLMAHP